MFAFLTRRPTAGPPPARKITLAVSVLELRECPAALTSHLVSDPIIHPTLPDAGHQPPAHMALARAARPLNPQPLPP